MGVVCGMVHVVVGAREERRRKKDERGRWCGGWECVFLGGGPGVVFRPNIMVQLITSTWNL